MSKIVQEEIACVKMTGLVSNFADVFVRYIVGPGGDYLEFTTNKQSTTRYPAEDLIAAILMALEYPHYEVGFREEDPGDNEEVIHLLDTLRQAISSSSPKDDEDNVEGDSDSGEDYPPTPSTE